MKVKRIESYEQLGGMITAQMKRGMVTNAFLSREDWEREIRLGAEFLLTEQGLLVFRNRSLHRVMSFWINDGFFDACPDLPGDTVCEIPMRIGDARTEAAADGWIRAGFEAEFTRQRMASLSDSGVWDSCIRKAEICDLETAEKLLRENFSVLTGCLPGRDELCCDISAGGVLLYGDVGLLHCKTAKNKSELRHLCVAESARGQGIGEKLVLGYHALTEGMRRTVWVREDFAPAKKIYEKCGYAADGMISRVLIRR